MTSRDAKNEFKEQCEMCGERVPSYEIINVRDGEKYKRHCNRCYNKVISEMYELDFEHPEFQPFTMKDVDGSPHEFCFRTHIIPSGVSIEALELIKGVPEGYQFQVLGPFEADPLELFGQLFERIRSALSMKHIETGEYGLQITDKNVVRGRITWDDENDGRIPRLVIDGKPVSWEELGRMLMAYEGWNFKLEIYDGSETR